MSKAHRMRQAEAAVWYRSLPSPSLAAMRVNTVPGAGRNGLATSAAAAAHAAMITAAAARFAATAARLRRAF